jgi:Na+-driven multidrug efflux pump
MTNEEGVDNTDNPAKSDINSDKLDLKGNPTDIEEEYKCSDTTLFKEENPSKWTILSKFINLASLVLLSTLMNGGIMLFSNYTKGNLGDPKKTTGIGISASVCGFFIMSISLGSGSALDTFATQAYGQGDLKLCGQYLNRARVIMATLAIPMIIIVNLFGRSLCSIFSSDEEVLDFAMT